MNATNPAQPINVPLSPVHLDADVEQSVLDVLRSGHLAQGRMVERLEHDFARLCGVAHAVAHGADVFMAVARSRHMQPGQAQVLLGSIVVRLRCSDSADC